MSNPNITDTPDTRRAVARYVSGIRNAEKRRYAEAYAASMLDGAPGPIDSKFRLGTMGAQAVRIAIGILVTPGR